MSDKKQKTKKTVLNVTNEWIIHFAIFTVQIAALVLIASLVKTRAWTYWVVLAVLIAITLYFGAMIFYKIYRARLTVVNISKERIVYRRAFKKTTIAADDITIALADYGKPEGKTKYALVYKKGREDEAFLLAVSGEKALAKLKDFAPRILLTFIISCTEASVLERAKEGASEELLEYIQKEFDAREEYRRQEQERARRARKRKKGKR